MTPEQELATAHSTNRSLLADNYGLVADNARLLLGYARYEKARKLNPRQWGDLYERNLKGEVFDEMIDALPPVVKDHLAGLASAGPSTQWQDISTAPRDGTEIVGAEWQAESEDYQPELFTHHTKLIEGAWRYPSGYSWTPTHWMPRPPPPGTAPPTPEPRKWRIEWENDVDAFDEVYWEWWTITDGTTSYKADSEDDAKRLLAILSTTSVGGD